VLSKAEITVSLKARVKQSWNNS